MPVSDKLKGLKETIGGFIHNDLFPQITSTDTVSTNTKVVLFGLFALIGFGVLTYAITVTGPNYKIDDPSNSKNATRLSETQKIERIQELEQVNAVYIAAISGSLALGGVLIAQLWGRG